MDTKDLIEFASDPAFGLDDEMKVTGWNSGAEKLLGYSRDEAAGLPCSQVLQAYYPTGEPLCSTMCEGRACISEGQKWRMDACQIRRKDGEMVDAGISSLVVPLEARSIGNDETVAMIFLRKLADEDGNAHHEVPLRIFTLGRFGLAACGKGLNVEGWKRKQAALVLKCLICNIGKPVHRERLIDWIWPTADVKSGWQRLKVTISYLRKALQEGGVDADIVETIGQSYLLRRKAVWVDSDIFPKLINEGWEFLKSGNFEKAQSRFDEAESLYRGELFEDDPYADWCAVERERLREVHLEMLTGMVRCYSEQGRFLEVARICRVALASDPCRENFIRAMMRSMASLNLHDWARAHFVTWRKTLDLQYGLEPTESTLNVYHQLIDKRAQTKVATGS